MPYDIDPETINADNLPGIWSPVQWELSEEERIQELEDQAAASLLSVVDVPEALLRLLLDETGIQRAFAPPKGYDPDLQGGWDDELVTFEFKRPVELLNIERRRDFMRLEYKIADLGYWTIEIEPDSARIFRQY
ncbi:MAG: hypothetical protein AB1894_11825 [Chloroflexota bacterium]